MTQPPGPPGPPAPHQPLGTVDLTIQGSVMTSSMITPDAWINGHPVRVAYGTTPITVPAGPVRVDLSAQWLRRYGQARISFTLAPGQRVPVYYVAPMHQFTTGSIGHQPVKRRGVGSFVLIMAAIAALVAAAFVLPVVLG